MGSEDSKGYVMPHYYGRTPKKKPKRRYKGLQKRVEKQVFFDSAKRPRRYGG